MSGLVLFVVLVVALLTWVLVDDEGLGEEQQQEQRPRRPPRDALASQDVAAWLMPWQGITLLAGQCPDCGRSVGLHSVPLTALGDGRAELDPNLRYLWAPVRCPACEAPLMPQEAHRG